MSVRRLLPKLLLLALVGLVAALTTMGAFSALMFSGFPILEQLGRFTALGVGFSFIFVHTVFPRIFPEMPAARSERASLNKVVDALARTGRYAMLAAVALALVALPIWRPIDPVYGPEGVVRYAPRGVTEALATQPEALYLALYPAEGTAAVREWISLGGTQNMILANSLKSDEFRENVGLQYPEKLATLTAVPMRWSVWLFRPLIWLFNGSGRLVLRLIGRDAVAEHTHIHSPEEIVMLVEESATGGLLTGGKLSPSRPNINKPEKEAYFQEAAKAFKKALDVPLILVGGIRSPEVAERLLADGTADYFSMSRPLIREPDLVNRWQSGDRSPARCLSDNLCFRPGMMGKGIYCVTEERKEAQQ